MGCLRVFFLRPANTPWLVQDSHISLRKKKIYINNCAQHQLLQANHFYQYGNHSPAFMAGGQGAGMKTPQQTMTQGNQQALPLNFQAAQ